MTALVDHSDVELDRDRGLVERHQAGDGTAFTQLYALHYGRLVRFCYRLTRDHHGAEEIAQEAFARAFASLDQLEGERRFYPWLTVIARRLVIDHVRRNSRLETRAHVDTGFTVPAEDIVVSRFDTVDVSAAMGRLSDRYQQVLRLRDGEGLSYDAIAERLDVPTTTIPPLLHRARAALRREYVQGNRSHVAAWLHLTPLWLAVRRLRDRVAIWTSHLPDPSIFAAPMAGAVLGATAWLAPHAMQDAPDTVQLGATTLGLDLPQLSAASRAEAMPADTAAGGGAAADSRTRNSKDFVNPGYALRDAGVRPEETVLRYVMQSDPATSDERQDEVRRMPIYYEEEYTGIYLGANPWAVVYLAESAAERVESAAGQ